MLRRRVNKYEEWSQLNTKIVRIGLESAKVTSHERGGVSNCRKHYRLLTRLCRMTSMKNQTSAFFLLWDRNHGLTGGALYKRNAGNVVCHGEQNYYKIKQLCMTKFVWLLCRQQQQSVISSCATVNQALDATNTRAQKLFRSQSFAVSHALQ